jgi:hypothetical protein
VRLLERLAERGVLDVGVERHDPIVHGESRASASPNASRVATAVAGA